MRSGERIDECVLQWFDHVERMENEGLLRESMNRNVLAVPQWVGRGRGESIP